MRYSLHARRRQSPLLSLPFLGVSSLDLGRSTFRVNGPFSLRIRAPGPARISRCLFGCRLTGVQKAGQRLDEIADQGGDVVAEPGVAGMPFQIGLVDIQRPVDLQLQALPAAIRIAVTFDELGPCIRLVDRHPRV